MDVETLLVKIAELEQIKNFRRLLSIEQELLDLEKNFLLEISKFQNNN